MFIWILYGLFLVVIILLVSDLCYMVIFLCGICWKLVMLSIVVILNLLVKVVLLFLDWIVF